MKKVIFTLTLVFCLSFVNAINLDEKKNCHAQACLELAAWENDFGELNEQMVEAIYEMEFNACNG